MNEESVRLAATLYESRDAMRRLFGEEYTMKIADYQDYIRAAMKKPDCDALNAVKILIELIQNESSGGMATALILAAYVEMIEPSEVNIK